MVTCPAVLPVILKDPTTVNVAVEEVIAPITPLSSCALIVFEVAELHTPDEETTLVTNNDLPPCLK